LAAQPGSVDSQTRRPIPPANKNPLSSAPHDRNAMSTASRICLRCRIQISNNGPLLPSAFALRSRRAGQRCLMARLRSRSYNPHLSGLQSRAFTTKTSDTPGKAPNSTVDGSQSKEEEYPLADPVRVKLDYKVESDRTGLPRPTKPVTTTDVEKFLAKVKKIKKGVPDDPAPSGRDARNVDRTYEMLLGNSMPSSASSPLSRTFKRQPLREPIDPSELPPVLRDAQSKCDFAPYRCTATKGF
jgi:hypothetical protein